MQIDSQPVPRRSRMRRLGARSLHRQAHYRTTRWREQSPKASIHMDHEALKHKVFGQLFQQNYAWLCARLSYRTGCAQSAQDIASETFLRVWSHTDPSAIREPRALLTTIAQRLMYEGWRRRELENAYLQVLAETPEQTHPSPQEQWILVESLLAIDRLLDGLSTQAKAVFVYSQIDGLTYTQIGQRLNLSLGRVHQLMTEALRCCYQELAG